VKRAAWVLGFVLSLLLLGYFVQFALATLAQQEVDRLWAKGPLVAIVAAAVLSAAVVALSAWAWRQLLTGSGESWGVRPLFMMMATTQLAKYVPGNVAQHVGRVGYALSLGMSAPALAASLLFETLLLLGAGVALGLAILGLDGRTAAVAGPSAAGPLLLMVAILLAAGFGLAWAMPRVQSLLAKSAWARERFRLDVAAPAPRFLARAAFAYVACYLMLGIGLWLIMQALGDGHGPGLVFLTGAFALAWLMGFLAPGVPAGLGAREGVLLLLLDGRAADDVLLAGIVAARLASVLGDLLCFLAGLVISINSRAKLRP
jgi:uncharacterized membrane protein YbhN (UPF0104 family)